MGQPRVVVIGAGFGGLQCVKALAHGHLSVTLIDRNIYHLFTPLLYQVASSLLNPSDISYPIRAALRGRRNARFLLAEATAIDFDRKEVMLAEGDPVPFDYLVIAAGSTTNYFGMSAMAERAFGLKNLPEALELRNHILECLEGAVRATDTAARERLLTFVVVGGGPTGVEYAGALSELLRLVVPSEYPELADAHPRIELVEGEDGVLPVFGPKLSASARRALERKGVEVITGERVSGGLQDSLQLSGGRSIDAATVVWAAGVRPAALVSTIDAQRSRSGRLEVDEYLRLAGRSDTFVIGDAAAFIQDGQEVPMLSAPAMQAGRHVARNIARLVAGQALRPFQYRDHGTMATIGRNNAVARVGPLGFSGFVGWVAWLAVHLYFIIGFLNRFVVLTGWAWNYVRQDRPVRIIARARTRERDHDGAPSGKGPQAGASNA